MKRLVIIIGNLNTGGGQRVVCKLAENIDKRKYIVDIICCRKKNNTAFEDKIERIATVHYLGINEGFSLLGYLKFDRLMRRIKPDAVHAHLGGVQYALVWGVIHHRIVVVTAHTTPEKAFTKRTENLLRYSLRKDRSILVAVSEENRLKCAAYFGLNNEKCKFVNNGVDLHPFIKYQRHEPFVFINVATQDNNKNQICLLKCIDEVSKHYSTRLILVGAGPEHETLIRYTEEHELKDIVLFTGEISEPENYYTQADVYVQSSHREAMPMSILEALSFGLPIISTDVGGIRDVVEGNGQLVQDGNDRGFYNAMVSLLTMAGDEFEKLRDNSYKIVEAYSSSHMAEEYEKIYESTY